MTDDPQNIIPKRRAATISELQTYQQSTDMTVGKHDARLDTLERWQAEHLGEHKGYGELARKHDHKIDEIEKRQIKHGKAIAVLVATAMGGGVSGALLTKLIGG